MLGCYLHTLPGTPFVYQGEELGMTNYGLPSIEDYDDIDTKNYYHTMIQEGAAKEEALAQAQSVSRDNARTPMQWDESPNAGFSPSRPWLPVNPNYTQINARQQMEDPDSIFQFYQKLIVLRKENPVMVHGDFRLCGPKEGPVIAYTRSLGEETWLAVHNFSDREIWFEHENVSEDSLVIISNYKDPKLKEGAVQLRPYETLVIRISLQSN